MLRLAGVCMCVLSSYATMSRKPSNIAGFDYTHRCSPWCLLFWWCRFFDTGVLLCLPRADIDLTLNCSHWMTHDNVISVCMMAVENIVIHHHQSTTCHLSRYV